MPDLTAQTILNTVAAHLRKQGQPARNPDTGTCQYRAKTASGVTLSCAVGCLITDEEYVPEMDAGFRGSTVRALIERKLLPAHLVEFERLLMGLQRVHDTLAYWGAGGFNALGERALRQVASDFDLTYPQPEYQS